MLILNECSNIDNTKTNVGLNTFFVWFSCIFDVIEIILLQHLNVSLIFGGKTDIHKLADQRNSLDVDIDVYHLVVNIVNQVFIWT